MNDDHARDVIARLSRIENEVMATRYAAIHLSRKMDERLAPLERFHAKIVLIASSVSTVLVLVLSALIRWFLPT